MLPRFQCRALGLKLGMRRAGCSDNVTGDVNQWIRQRRKDVVSKAVGESVHSHLDQYYFLSSKVQTLQPYLPHCTRVIMKKKSCPPSSFLHGLLRYYRCPRGRKCTSSVAVTRPLDGLPRNADLSDVSRRRTKPGWRETGVRAVASGSLGSYRTRYRR